MCSSMTAELLYALIRDSHQQFVMIVRIVGMTLEVRMNTFNTCFSIPAYLDPIRSSGLLGVSAHGVVNRFEYSAPGYLQQLSCGESDLRLIQLRISSSSLPIDSPLVQRSFPSI